MELPTLTTGDEQLLVLIVTATLSIIVVAFLAFAALRTRADIPYEQVAERGYRYRTPWAISLVVLLGVVGGLSFAKLPSGVVKDAPADSTVHVTAMQFGFALDPATVTAGDRVAFEVSAIDVNHGFGVYDPDGVLIGQAQAMPGRVNRLVLDVDEPGTYDVLCMEYCGLAHHMMLATFEATEGAEA